MKVVFIPEVGMVGKPNIKRLICPKCNHIERLPSDRDISISRGDFDKELGILKWKKY